MIDNILIGNDYIAFHEVHNVGRKSMYPENIINIVRVFNRRLTRYAYIFSFKRMEDIYTLINNIFQLEDRTNSEVLKRIILSKLESIMERLSPAQKEELPLWFKEEYIMVKLK